MIDGELASRLQANLLATKIAGVAEVELDFTGVDQIGQDFADQLLCVWPLANPETHVSISNMSEHVLSVVSHVITRGGRPGLL